MSQVPQMRARIARAGFAFVVWFAAASTASASSDSLALVDRDGRHRHDVSVSGVVITDGVHAGVLWSLRFAGYGRGATLATPAQADVVVSDEHVEIRRGALVEWYVDDARGLEQGFTIASAPERAASDTESSPLRVALEWSGAFEVVLAADARALVFDAGADRASVRMSELQAFDAGGRELDARFAVDGCLISVCVDDADAVYPLTIDPFILVDEQHVVMTEAAPLDLFGRSVAIYADTIAIGAPSDDVHAQPDLGSVTVLVRNGTAWVEQAKLTPADIPPLAGFGTTVALGADTLAVGVPSYDGAAGAQQGAVYVYVRNGNAWDVEAKLLASDAAALDRFGCAVALDDQSLVVGARLDDEPGSVDRGGAYVFVRNGVTWTQQAKLSAPSTVAGDNFGQSVAISGDTAIVTAPFHAEVAGPSVGAAEVFVRAGSTWTHQAHLIASDGAASDELGTSVAISGNTALVGTIHDDDRGAVYAFVRSGATWTEQEKLVGVDTGRGDGFSAAIGFLGNVAVIGAPGDSGVAGDGLGAAYVFARSATTWYQLEKVRADVPVPHANFGAALSFNGSRFVVGAPFEDGPAGVDQGGAEIFRLITSGASTATFCSGDGSLLVPCPCAFPDFIPSPSAAPGYGCASSFNLSGGLLLAKGELAPDELRFTGLIGPGYANFAFLVKGNGLIGTGLANGDGVRCVGGALIRFGGHNAGTNGAAPGVWTYPNDVQTMSVSQVTAQPANQLAYYQLVYRNAVPGFCSPATSNITSGIVVDWP